MAATGPESFDTSVQKTNEILHEIMDSLEIKDRKRAYTALKAVLHAVRDRLPVNEAVQLAGPFTILLKGVYFDGWRPQSKPQKMTRQEFLERIQVELAGYLDQEPQDVVRTVLEVLIEKNNLEDVSGLLPHDFSGVIPIKR
ncbi:DUF2267 domain-containing protein [Candidatus Woesearchaeota archaeon]|nr:DUF2267 domain-containing protein [Candidatus Woesearchaeota archaeon]